MCHLLQFVFTFSFVVLQCYALTCRSEGGPKEEDLKKIYSSCLKKQENKNSSDNRGFQDDQDWKESRGRLNQKNPSNRDEGEEDREDRSRNSGDRNGGRDDRMNSRNHRMGMGSKEDRTNRDDRMGEREDRRGGRDDRRSDRDEKTSGRVSTDRNHILDKTEHFGEEPFNDRFNFPQNHEFDSDVPRYNDFHSTTHPYRRFKRSKRTEMNSGQRSQYNPNLRKPSDYEGSYKDDDKNSSNSSRDMDSKACALHCFLEQLEMTGDNGMPDKYLVTHAITKDVKNEDLRDFLQESIEECFQILNNENTEDKCEFSKNLMMCLSEKGRANCDDWKDDLKF